MQIHNVIRRSKNKKVMIVGRGGKRGKTSGRGTKGQNARAGHKKYPEIRDMIKKLPKLRGYSFKSFANKNAVVNVGVIENNFESGAKINPVILIEKGLIKLFNGRLPQVKILGEGEITKKITVENCLVSGEAKLKIEKAGGNIVARVEKITKQAAKKTEKKAKKASKKPKK